MNTYIVKSLLFWHICQAEKPSEAYANCLMHEVSLNNMLDVQEVRDRLMEKKFMFIQSTYLPEVYLQIQM